MLFNYWFQLNYFVTLIIFISLLSWMPVIRLLVISYILVICVLQPKLIIIFLPVCSNISIFTMPIMILYFRSLFAVTFDIILIMFVILLTVMKIHFLLLSGIILILSNRSFANPMLSHLLLLILAISFIVLSIFYSLCSGFIFVHFQYLS